MKGQQLKKITKVLAQIARKNCMLVIGPISAGKTTVIKYQSGEKLKLIDEKFIDENQQQIKAKSTRYGIDCQFQWFINQQKQLLVIEICDFINSNPPENENQINNQGIYVGLLILKILAQLCENFAINIVVNFQFLINHIPLANFLTVWQSCLNKDQKMKQKIKSATVISLTKAQFAEDAEQIYNMMVDISQQQQMSQNSSFLRSPQQIYTFLNADTSQQNGQQMLQNIMTKLQFMKPNQLFTQNYISIIIDHLKNQQKCYTNLKQIHMKNIQEFQHNIEDIGQIVIKMLLLIYINKLKKILKQFTNLLQTIKDHCTNLGITKQIQIIDYNKILLPDDYEQICDTILFIIQIEHKTQIKQTQKLKLVYQSIFEKQYWHKIQQNDQFFKIIKKYNHGLLLQMQLFQLFDKKSTQERIQKIVTILPQKLIQQIQNAKIFEIMETNDVSFKNSNLYGEFAKYFKKQTKTATSCQIIYEDNSIKRKYTDNNQIRQKIQQFLQNFKQPQGAKAQSIVEVSKLLMKIPKQKNTCQSGKILIKKLIQYRQFQLCIATYIRYLKQPPQLNLLREYFQILKNDNKKDRYKFIKQALIPFLLNQVITSQDYQSAKKSHQLIYRCFDFLQSETITDKQSYVNLEKYIRQIPLQKFQYKEGQKPNSQKQYKLDEDLKKNIKLQINNKMKQVNKIKQRVKGVLSYISKIQDIQK